MITCERCGTAGSRQDRFCGSCGEFLNWDANDADEADAAPVAAEPEPSPVAATPVPAESPQPTQSPEAPATPKRTPAPTAPPRPPTPTGIACRSCGTDNDTGRHFCRFCGSALRETPAAEKESWWQRRRRRRRERPAGFRRKARRRPRLKAYILIPLIAVVVLGLIAAIPALPIANPWLDSVRDRIVEAVPVTPSAITASSESAPASQAFDGLSNEYWAPDRAGDGVGEWVEAEFGEPVRLVYLVISSGISRDQEEFLSQARPKDIELEMRTEGGGTETETLTVADSAEPQTFRLGVSDVTGVRLTILSTYGFEPDRAVAVAELEYFIRR